MSRVVFSLPGLDRDQRRTKSCIYYLCMTSQAGTLDLNMSEGLILSYFSTTDHTDISSDHAFLKDSGRPDNEVDDGEQQHWKSIEDVESDFAMGET
jgi:hypothetical protein